MAQKASGNPGGLIGLYTSANTDAFYSLFFISQPSLLLLLHEPASS